MSEPVVVLGNGPSRRQLDPLEQIPYDTIGCNGLILEFQPTFLMYGDKKAAAEIEALGLPHAKPPEEHDVYDFESCGGAAFHTACSMGYNPVYLIGFDGDGPAHACPEFGLRRDGRWSRMFKPGLWDRKWVDGFRRVRLMYPDVLVYLLGNTPSYLSGMFPRCSLKPWLDVR